MDFLTLSKSEREHNSPHGSIIHPFTTGAIFFDPDACREGHAQIEAPQSVSPSPNVKGHYTTVGQVIHIIFFFSTANQVVILVSHIPSMALCISQPSL